MNCRSPVCSCMPRATPGLFGSESKYMKQETSSAVSLGTSGKRMADMARPVLTVAESAPPKKLYSGSRYQPGDPGGSSLRQSVGKFLLRMGRYPGCSPTTKLYSRPELATKLSPP